MARIEVEFYGTARLRAGVERVALDAASIADATRQLAGQFDDLRDCFQNEAPTSGWLLNLNGDQFTRDPDTPLNDGDCLLLMPADAGG